MGRPSRYLLPWPPLPSVFKLPKSRLRKAPNPKREDHPHFRLHVENLPLEEPPQPLPNQVQQLQHNGLHRQHAHILPDIIKVEGEIAEAHADVLRFEEVEVEKGDCAGFAEAVEGRDQFGFRFGRGGDGAEVEQAEGVG